MTQSEASERSIRRSLLLLAFLLVGAGCFFLGRSFPAAGGLGKAPARPESPAQAEAPTQGGAAQGTSSLPEAKRYATKEHHYQHLLDDPKAKDYMRRAFADVVARRDLRMSIARQKRLATLFHRLSIWQNNWFMGIRIQKNPCDLWMMHQIIYEIRPDYIIEAGTFRGGSALYFAHMLSGLGLDDSRVITIDIEHNSHEAEKLPLWQRHVELIHGSSTDPDVVDRIGSRVKGSKVIVVLDSDHSRDHVFQELLSYGPLVSPGSYVVVEDTNLDAVPIVRDYQGPMAAVVAFLRTEEGNEFTQDFSREAMVLTFNPGGWLRRNGPQGPLPSRL